MLHLFCTQRFFPLLITQFLGAFNDNLFKNALIILLVFGSLLQSDMDTKILATVASGLFILPYVLFSATAGQLADKIEKSLLVRCIKWCEVVLMLLATLGFLIGSVWLLLLVLFLMGTQSTFFSPLKYSLIPDHLREDEILGGNALIEMGTFLAILTGTIAGGLLVSSDIGIVVVYVTLVVLAFCGVVASYNIPTSGPFSPTLRFNFNLFSETISLLRYAFSQRVVALAVLAISWFWFVGATFLSQFPAFTRETLGGNEQVITLLLTVFSVGVGIGSLLSHRLLRGIVSPKYAPVSALLMSVFMFDMYWVSHAIVPIGLVNAATFITDVANLRVLFDLFMIALCGGVYIVPLNAVLQTYTHKEERARMIAANNLVNALFMVLSAVGITVLLLFHVSIAVIFFVVGILNLVITVWLFTVSWE